MVTFVYSAYFTQALAADPIAGTALWSRALVITALLVAIASPPLGALADGGGYRGRMLLGFTAGCVAATAGLYFAGPGQVALALGLFVVANVCFELATVFYNALLPEVAPRRSIGSVSGYGWALGYLGGLLALALVLFALVWPDPPWFGFSKAGGENIRASNLVAAVWFAVFSLPLFVWLATVPARPAVPRAAVAAGLRRLAATARRLGHYRQMVRFLLARLCYIDALVTLFAFGGIYAAGTFGFSFDEILLFGIVLNLAAGVGALALGFVDDRLGGKRTLQISLIGLGAASLLAALADSRWQFWLAGIVIGVFSGPLQSASRSLMGRFAPPDKQNEFFGLFAFSGKATAFLGPLLLGWATEAFASQRVGVAIVPLLFALGFVLLLRVDERAGVAAAGRDVLDPDQPPDDRGRVG